MPKAFTEQEKDLIRERLLEQGTALFASYGLKKTSVEELAVAVGISKAAFYLFYPSKEALFIDVVELAEAHFRQEVLAQIDLPGSSPRARLVAVFKKAFSLWRTIPLLRVFTRDDYNLLFRKLPQEIVQEHLSHDQEFIYTLISRCQTAGISIKAPPEQIGGLMYALFFTSLHEDDLGPDSIGGTIDILLELVAAFCLGEVDLQAAGQGTTK
jgi:AcrR family transcriptional regulator